MQVIKSCFEMAFFTPLYFTSEILGVAGFSEPMDRNKTNFFHAPSKDLLLDENLVFKLRAVNQPQYLLLALGLHLGLLGLSFFAPAPHAPLPEILVVEFISPSPTKKAALPILQQRFVPPAEQTENTELPATALSRDRIRVRQETQASQFGRTQNQVPQAGAGATQTQQQASRSLQRIPPDLDSSEVSIASTLNSSRDLTLPNSGRSTISTLLPAHIAQGSMTLLNTDSFVHYSFFMRIEALIRPRWEEKVFAALAPVQQKSSFSSDFRTDLKVLVRPNGLIHSIHILKKSGFKALDDAASLPFAEARFFPNPPQELVEESGFIELSYSFLVRTPQKILASP